MIRLYPVQDVYVRSSKHGKQHTNNELLMKDRGNEREGEKNREAAYLKLVFWQKRQKEAGYWILGYVS